MHLDTKPHTTKTTLRKQSTEAPKDGRACQKNHRPRSWHISRRCQKKTCHSGNLEASGFRAWGLGKSGGTRRASEESGRWKPGAQQNRSTAILDFSRTKTTKRTAANLAPSTPFHKTLILRPGNPSDWQARLGSAAPAEVVHMIDYNTRSLHSPLRSCSGVPLGAHFCLATARSP